MSCSFPCPSDDFYSEISSVLNSGRIAQRVSRAWKSRIHGRCKTYAFLDLTTRDGVPKSSLRAYIARSKGNVRKVVLSGSSTDSTLLILTRRCRQLSILRINRSQIALGVLVKEAFTLPNLTVLATDFRFYSDSFIAILERCVSLRTFECRRIICSEPINVLNSNLRRLKVWDDDTYAFPSLGLEVS